MDDLLCHFKYFILNKVVYISSVLLLLLLTLLYYTAHCPHIVHQYHVD